MDLRMQQIFDQGATTMLEQMLRTQAFASLHSSLQNNSSLPVTHVARWLGIEEEDIESILDYYGFLIKEFEEPYMVKEGSFLNAENDYPTKCSRLVHQKRSRTIAGDVAVNEEMPDSKLVPSPKDRVQLHSLTETSKDVPQLQDGLIKSGASKPFNFSLARSSPRSLPAKVVVMEKANNDALFSVLPERTITSGMEQIPLPIMLQASQPERAPGGIFNCTVENSIPRSMAIDNVKSVAVRSPSGKYDYIITNSVPQTMAISDLKSLTERPSDEYCYTLESLVPQGMAVNYLGDKASG